MQPNKNLEKRIRNFFIIFCGITAIFFAIYMQKPDNKKIGLTQNWTPTQAFIKNEKIDLQNDTKLSLTFSCITLFVEYPFQGKNHETNFQADCEDTSGSLNANQAEVLLRQNYPLNSKIDILVDPLQPKNIITVKELNSLIHPKISVAIVPMEFYLLGIILIFIGLIRLLLLNKQA